jgi:large subunit ribosomal protein L6
MSRVAKNPIDLPKGVEAKVDGLPAGQTLSVKGAKGSLTLKVHPAVSVTCEGGQIRFAPRTADRTARTLAGTARAHAANMVAGVSKGFQKKLELVGVGYRAQAQGRRLNLQVGLSHAVVYELPAGIDVQTPSQTEIVVGGADVQLVGRVASEIRGFRPPEPYKGKGVRYVGERIQRKEAKKK